MTREFIEATRRDAIHKWKWHSPWLAGLLGTTPLGMVYTSVKAAIIYAIVGVVWGNWEGRPRWAAFLIILAAAAYAYTTTRHRNAAIEHWKYGLPGTGTQNPKGMSPITGPDTVVQASGRGEK